MLVGTVRCAVPARVQRAERIIEDVRITLYVSPLNAAPTAQRHLYPVVVSRCALSVSAFHSALASIS
jgi:hypothetical protein